MAGLLLRACLDVLASRRCAARGLLGFGPQVQAENIQQAETLVKLTEKLEGLNSDVQDTQQLIGALHSEFQTIQP